METFAWRGFDPSLGSHQVLQGFLVLDVQYSASQAEELADGIHRYLRGDWAEFSGSGNGYSFDCTPEGFRLECLYPGDELSPVVLPFSVVLEALHEWAVFCRQQAGGAELYP